MLGNTFIALGIFLLWIDLDLICKQGWEKPKTYEDYKRNIFRGKSNDSGTDAISSDVHSVPGSEHYGNGS